jgi:hypothetical protein
MVESATLLGGKQIRPEYYVCAVPPWSLNEMGVPNSSAVRLRWNSTVGVHLFYEDATLDFERVCVIC